MIRQVIKFFVAGGISLCAQVSTAQKTLQDKQVFSGKMIYEQNCLTCHQVDASGVPRLAPPLISSEYVNGEKTRLIKIVLSGMQGVEIKGKKYYNPMPPFDSLSDRQIADLLTYVRANFRNVADPVKVEEVTKTRKAKK